MTQPISWRCCRVEVFTGPSISALDNEYNSVRYIVRIVLKNVSITYLLEILYDQIGKSRASRWRTPHRNVSINAHNISACRQHRNVISKAISMFSGLISPSELPSILNDWKTICKITWLCRVQQRRCSRHADSLRWTASVLTSCMTYWSQCETAVNRSE